MKKIIALILAAAMLLTLLVACGKKETTDITETDEVFAPETEIVTPETENLPAEEVPEAEVPAQEEAPSVETPPAKAEAPAAPETPAVSESPKEETKPVEEVIPAPAAPEAEKEEPTLQIPSETPVLPPSSAGITEPAEVETPAVSTTKELSEIIDAIYRINDPILPAMTMPVDLSDAYSLSSFTGLSDASMIAEAVASESMMGAQAYSLVLVRLKDAANAQTVAKNMRNGIDQRKWICVTADDIRVVACGDVVMLCMISSQLDVKVNDMITAFGTVMGSNFTVDIS